MTVFDHPSFDGHESVHALFDPDAGVRAFVAVHSTRRGPSAGGTRFWRYDDEADALTDALRLSRAMSYKNAMADLPLGGGKAVVMRPEGDFDRTALFARYGALIDRLGGSYVTAEDVGVTPHDMRVIAGSTRHVAGLPEGEGASGDPSPVTARGVFLGMKACAARRFGTDDMRDMRVAVQGVGHVGAYLCRLLAEAGARLVVADVDPALVRDAADRFGAGVVAPDTILEQDVEVLAPCALGGVINEETLPRLTCSVIAGAANNQLRGGDVGRQLAERDILYAPDYVINAGGIINIASEISGAYDPDWVDGKIDKLVATLGEVVDRARAERRATSDVADEMARARLAV